MSLVLLSPRIASVVIGLAVISPQVFVSELDADTTIPIGFPGDDGVRGNFSSLWSEDIRLTNDSDWSIWPSITVDAERNIHVVWISGIDIGGGEVRLTKLDRSGNALVDSILVAGYSTRSKFPEVASDSNGNSHIIWILGEGLQSEIYYSMISSNGTKLIDMTRLSFNDKQTFSPWIDVDGDGNVHIVWVEGIDIGGDHAKLYYTKLDPSLDDQDGDSAVDAIISVIDDVELVDDARDSRVLVDVWNNVHVSFEKIGEIYWKLLDRNGTTLIDDTRLTFAPNASHNPSLASDDLGRLYVAWHDRRDGFYSEIYFTLIDPNLDDQDGNSAIDSQIAVIDDTRLSYLANRSSFLPISLWSSDGNVSIVWPATGVPTGIHRTKMNAVGDITIDSELVNEVQGKCAVGESHYLDAAVDSSGRIHMVWWDSRHGNDEIYYKYSLNGQSGKPVADAGGPYIGFEGSPVEFNATNSSGPPGSPLEYRWDFENDGSWDTNWTSDPTATHTYYDDFVGEVVVEVRAPSIDVEDVVHDYPRDFHGMVSVVDSVAQSFVPQHSSISKVTLDVAVDGEPGADLYVSIRTSLNGTNLTSTSLPPEEVPKILWCEFVDFDLPDIPVVPGDTYFIVVTAPTYGVGYYRICGTFVDYPNGTNWAWEPALGWINHGELGYPDLRFKTYSSAGEVSDIDTASVAVYNVPPAVEWTSESSDGSIIAPPYPEGKEILFEATVSDPGIYDTFTYDWDLGDGPILLDAGPSVTHTYGDNDIYIVVVTVTDDDGGVGIDDTPPLDTTNENPIASIDMPYCIFTEGSYPCEAIGQFTDPGWLDTHSGVWDYGDGTYENAVLTGENDPPDATGMNITSHIYGDDGTYVITFTVLDDDGGVGSATAEAQVQNLPPSLDMIAPSSVNEGEDFVLGITVTDPGSDDITVVVDWGDGTSEAVTHYNNGIGPDPPNSGEGVYPFTVYSNLTHAYGDNGNFTIQVTVEDDDGGSVQEIVTIGVLNLPPQVGLPTAPLIFEEGEDFSLTATATDPGSDDLEFTWSFELGPSFTSLYYNDGTGPDPPLSPWGTFPFSAEDTVAHTYGDNGLYDVTITVSDDDGGSSASTLTIEVVNVEPSVDIGGPYAGNENSLIEFTATATDPGSDDLTFIWDWGDGTTDAMAFYNDGMSNDPPKSPWGTYPFEATHTVSHIWGDNGNFTVTLTVTDDDGGISVQQTEVIVNNVAPSIDSIRYFLNASFSFRIAGEKWHDVEIHLYEDGTEVGYANITRYPRSPNDQMVTLADISIDFSRTYSAVAYYTPEDDPVNGQIWGATPAWVILEYEDGEERIHHTFNVRHEETWTWTIDDFSPYFLGHNITFTATASDPGSDDLTFTWNWGDGSTTEHTYYNDGIGPDPYPSPEVNPAYVTDEAEHSYTSAGTYVITLTVTDDDGGVASYTFNLTL